MIVEPTKLDGVWIIDVERRQDDRGFFARTFCAEELGAIGLDTRVTQTSLSFNERRGTLRGLHLQRAPHGETKIVRCSKGRIYDVVVDLRPTSPTFCDWYAAELSEQNRRALYIPSGCAHGFQTLADESEVFYMMGGVYVPTSAIGYRYDDPAFGVSWPERITAISPKDLAFQPFSAS